MRLAKAGVNEVVEAIEVSAVDRVQPPRIAGIPATFCPLHQDTML